MTGTVFLAQSGSFCAEQAMITEYLIEVPKNSPMRTAFEYGEITSEEFWNHKGWLIELVTAELMTVLVSRRYIHPDQMCQTVKNQHKELQYKGPYHQKMSALEFFMETSQRSRRRDPRPDQQRYREFIKQHGQRLLRSPGALAAF